MPENLALQIRKAEPKDLLPVMALDASMSATPWGEQAIGPYFRPSPGETHFALVLETAGETAGFLIYTRLVDQGSIDNLAVAAECRGRGWGTALLVAALRNMSAAGLRRCLLDVRESNLAARALYENNGFAIDGVRPRYYKTAQGFEDALLMSRRL